MLAKGLAAHRFPYCTRLCHQLRHRSTFVATHMVSTPATIKPIDACNENDTHPCWATRRRESTNHLGWALERRPLYQTNHCQCTRMQCILAVEIIACCFILFGAASWLPISWTQSAVAYTFDWNDRNSNQLVSKQQNYSVSKSKWKLIFVPSIHDIDFSTIMDLHRRFVSLCRKGILSMDVFSFIETKFTELSIFYLRIVGIDSGGTASSYSVDFYLLGFSK